MIKNELVLCRIKGVEEITNIIFPGDYQIITRQQPDPAIKVVNKKVNKIEPDCFLWTRVNEVSLLANENLVQVAERFMNIKYQVDWETSNCELLYRMKSGEYKEFSVIHTFNFNFRNYGILDNGVILCGTDLSIQSPYRINQGDGSWTWFELNRELAIDDIEEIRSKLMLATKRDAKEFVDVWNKNYNEYLTKVN